MQIEGRKRGYQAEITPEFYLDFSFFFDLYPNDLLPEIIMIYLRFSTGYQVPI